MPPHRRVDLHRRALAALADPPGGAPELARLVHHAEAAGDVDAVLRFAPAAAARAASLGAYREAAAQYARALGFGDRLAVGVRAELLERRSHACYLTDQNDAAVEAIRGGGRVPPAARSTAGGGRLASLALAGPLVPGPDHGSGADGSGGGHAPGGAPAGPRARHGLREPCPVHVRPRPGWRRP